MLFRMHRLKFLIAYEGTGYLGWQKTGPGPSIQGCLQDVLTQITRRHVAVTGASRTDRGVHAEGQVAHADLIWPHPLRGLHHRANQLLPADIRILEIESVNPTFHATLDAQSKEYHYWIETASVCDPHIARSCWHVPSHLDLELMRQCALQLQGERDFATLCNQRSLWRKGTQRCLHTCNLLEQGTRLRIQVIGDQFLYKMVRNLVGLLVYIGRGKIAAAHLPDILASGHRPQAGITAPAQGLILHKVNYLIRPMIERRESGA
jgi:tRNA pseudouridine38-40 synthase